MHIENFGNANNEPGWYNHRAKVKERITRQGWKDKKKLTPKENGPSKKKYKSNDRAQEKNTAKTLKMETMA